MATEIIKCLVGDSIKKFFVEYEKKTSEHSITVSVISIKNERGEPVRKENHIYREIKNRLHTNLNKRTNISQK